MSYVNTAAGPVRPEDLGPTLTHEHLLINMMDERRGDGLLNDPDLMTHELNAFSAQGGKTVFDLTTAELTTGTVPLAGLQSRGGCSRATRDTANVSAVADIARAASLNVVLGTGHYRDPFLDHDFFDRMDSNKIAEELVHDITHGFGDTGIKAGVIGEIGADKWHISAREERSFRAAARAHRQTGAAIYTHAARWDVGHAQLDLLEEEKVDPSRIAIGHVDTVPIKGYATALAERGVYVGIDTINSANTEEVKRRVAIVMELVAAGYASKILLSHDVCLTSQLRSNGGNGFGFILGEFRDELLVAGLDSDVFTDIVSVNPANFVQL